MMDNMIAKRERNHLDEDKDAFATKGDVRGAVDELAQVTNKTFNRMEQRLDRIESAMATKEELGSVRRSVESILVVVEENNQLLKEVRRLPERVERLERSVFQR